MITQSFKNGDTEIRVESAESLEDAKTNGFEDDNYTRYFINNKPVVNYSAIIHFIVQETARTGKKFIPPTYAELQKRQREMIQKQNENIKRELEKLKKQYKDAGVPDHVIKQLEESIDKIDLAGVRVVE